ncbi:hypothetical protein Cgig2_003768 [Carnegiea gigantea]|uniref:Uncharacterized protein n=1 Tax=Carnegiea gigantea TaxID=171969 RepID=A0A9Q1GME3_9CARY|nr:hypothetical protein Cgig2_003768 [Carnegiea gigantea]
MMKWDQAVYPFEGNTVSKGEEEEEFVVNILPATQTHLFLQVGTVNQQAVYVMVGAFLNLVLLRLVKDLKLPIMKSAKAIDVLTYQSHYIESVTVVKGSSSHSYASVRRSPRHMVVGGEDGGLGVVVHMDDEGPPLKLGGGGGKGGGVEEEEQRENQGRRWLEMKVAMELTVIRKSLNVEVQQLRSEFQELRTTLQQQQEDVTASLRSLGLQDLSRDMGAPAACEFDSRDNIVEVDHSENSICATTAQESAVEVDDNEIHISLTENGA